MIELIYYSISSDSINDVDITTILNAARTFNLKNNITGCLVHHNNEFIQILEGEEMVIKELYSKIVLDKRHHTITLLAQNYKQERHFKDWNMAYYNLSRDDMNEINKKLFYNNIYALSEFAQKPTYAIKLFWQIAQDLLKD